MTTGSDDTDGTEPLMTSVAALIARSAKLKALLAGSEALQERRLAEARFGVKQRVTDLAAAIDYIADVASARHLPAFLHASDLAQAERNLAVSKCRSAVRELGAGRTDVAMNHLEELFEALQLGEHR